MLSTWCTGLGTSMAFDYDWIDAVTLGCWQVNRPHMSDGRVLCGRVTIYEDDPHFCSVSVDWPGSGPLKAVRTCRDVYLGEDSDPDTPLFMGNAVDFACEWIEAVVTGRPLPTGGEC